MSKWLVQKIIKNQDVKDNTVKQKVGTKASIVGILCNLLLFGFKTLVGIISGSITIISDGLNNLSDCASCVVSMWGYRMAAKPADSDHPYGHGRAEFVATFVIAFFILLVGFECATSSLEKIFHPTLLLADTFTVIVLVGSILVKLWMGSFYKIAGETIDNSTLLASSQDSYNDTLITLASLVAIAVMLLFDINIDGIMGLCVSVFIMISAVKLLKETVEELISQTPDQSLVNDVKSFICSHDIILGVHDMMVHIYGNDIYASAHVEVDCSLNILDVHDVIDNIENEVYDQFKVHLTLHMDPVEINNPRVEFYKKHVIEYLNHHYPDTSVHDFRVVSGPTHDNCVFDVDMPFSIAITKKELSKQLNEYLTNHSYREDIQVITVLQLDRH